MRCEKFRANPLGVQGMLCTRSWLIAEQHSEYQVSQQAFLLYTQAYAQILPLHPSTGYVQVRPCFHNTLAQEVAQRAKSSETRTAKEASTDAAVDESRICLYHSPCSCLFAHSASW